MPNDTFLRWGTWKPRSPRMALMMPMSLRRTTALCVSESTTRSGERRRFSGATGMLVQ
ncbi:hypothetical protein BC477_19980 [Clavibacter michiganensis subsp. michiganensis]|uniref:Uncharacterized protein n=1 Tax=Clavibacter michiganensis subsp. michiganensis TaxID=33013 RepID=A0A251XD46_CLAMM|nr:hypothetical protein BC477_19980 [Clavibacter michiganensis subsp. michiganensis]OUD99969.1 hypothetical protein CMMCAS07_19520 [Clavibacter michiganensis subsp. michiganensis]